MDVSLLARRRLQENDKLFEDGNRFCSFSTRQKLNINVGEQEDDRSTGEVMCSVSGCKQIYESVAAYDTHYNACHRCECSECHRRFPNAHLVDIHILENHDTLFQAMADEQIMFRCLLESCPVKSCDSAQRRQHAINDHHFPATFRFFTITSTLSSLEKMQVDETSSKKNPDKSRRKPQFPKNVCFGRGSTRGFHRGKRSKMSVKDLQQAIDEI